MCNHPNREAAMVVIADGIWCDPCLVPLVKALNEGGVRTVASCCGHGKNAGSIALADGRWLVITDEPPSRDQTEDGLAERVVQRILNTVDPLKPGHVVRASCVEAVRALLADQPVTTAGGGDRG